MSEKRTVSFIVPVFNAEETVCETLRGIAAQRTDIPFEIIVVDDGSSDASADAVRSWIADEGDKHNRIETILILNSHGGEAAAMNAGLERASSPFIAWVESDVKLDVDWLTLLLAEFENETVVGAGGLILPADDDTAIARIFGYEVAYKIKSNTHEARHITSANAVYRKSIFDELGPCRDELGASSFDSEYNQRIRNAGYTLRCNPKARARHHFKDSLWQCLKRTWWYGFRRPCVESQVLYPFDRWVGLTVLLTSLLYPAAILLFFQPEIAGGMLVGVFLVNVVYALFLYSRFWDTVLLFSPFVFLLRNITFFGAYLIGWSVKLFRGHRKP